MKIPRETVRLAVAGMAVLCVLIMTGCESKERADPASRFESLLNEAWELRLQENPLFATFVGVHRFDDRLPSAREESLEERAEKRREFLSRLEQIDRNRLSQPDQINYDMFERQLQDAVQDHEFKSYLMPINADSGFHISFARLPSRMPLRTTEDYENYLSRLRAFSRYMSEHIDLMRKGIETGYTVPQVTLEGYERTIESQIVEDPTDSVFYAPFAALPSGVPEGEHSRLREAARSAIGKHVVPAYRSFREFMVNEYIPNARRTLGASDLPNGDAYYGFLIRHYTTLELTPEEVHERGLQEVKRIRREMQNVIDETGFQGGFAEFLQFLRTDPRFYAETSEELLKNAAYIAKRMDGKLPSLFGTLPRLPYGIQPVPDDLAPKYTGGRYISAPLGSSEAGYYWINTYQLNSRPLYLLPALTLHEAVPGHHLQIALAREREELPMFRRFYSVTAFSEGWALYSERLGLEAGFYQNPYSNFGRLSYEMWRACRLVVDTGIHAMGWSRAQVMDYLGSNTALSLHEVRTETDRYISTPGQALAYKIGELKIRELRDRAEQKLGAGFDVRKFHDVVLLDGAIPLPLLERKIDSYIEEELRQR